MRSALVQLPVRSQTTEGARSSGRNPFGEALVFGDDHGLVVRRVLPELVVRALRHCKVQHMHGLMAGVRQAGRQGVSAVAYRRETSRRLQPDDAVVGLGGGELEAGPDILGLEELVIIEDLPFRCPGGEQVQHVLDPQPVAPDAGAASACDRVQGDPIQIVRAHRGCNLPGHLRLGEAISATGGMPGSVARLRALRLVRRETPRDLSVLAQS